jgi:hypothetical protein
VGCVLKSLEQPTDGEFNQQITVNQQQRSRRKKTGGSLDIPSDKAETV